MLEEIVGMCPVGQDCVVLFSCNYEQHQNGPFRLDQDLLEAAGRLGDDSEILRNNA